MTTVIPQGELTRRAIDWICEKAGGTPQPARVLVLIEEAAMRFNLGPLEVEFLERFFEEAAAGEKQS
jgi:hypothetical protein